MTPDFKLDPSFGQGGFLPKVGGYVRATPFEPTVLAVDASGRILYGYGTTQNAAIRRLMSNGADDTSFGGDISGLAGVPPLSGNSGSFATAAAVQPDGRILVLGVGRTGMLTVGRLIDAGLPDTSFGNGGGVTLDVPSNGPDAGAVVLQPDGKIIIAGRVAASQTASGVKTSDAVVVRLLPSG